MDFKCDGCGVTFSLPGTPVPPIRCFCGHVSGTATPTVIARPTFPEGSLRQVDRSGAVVPWVNPWVLIHTHLAERILGDEPWNPSTEILWYSSKFMPLIPRGTCGCEDHWAPISKTLNWSSAEAAFKSFWRAHNEVSEQHAKKPTITYEHCRALYLPQPSMDDCCIAVTSLSPTRLARQTECLDSWKKVGFTIAAVQAEDEDLQEQYPQVSHWYTHPAAGPPTINAIADVATTLDTPILIINSDIEIHGEQRLIREAMAPGGTLVGVRHNYDDLWWTGEAEQWGLDVFGILPGFARTMPRLALHIGRPMWDYWVPHHAKLTGSTKYWIKEPLFFHKKHALNWTQEDWQAGADVFMKHYNVDPYTNWALYREAMNGP